MLTKPKYVLFFKKNMIYVDLGYNLKYTKPLCCICCGDTVIFDAYFKLPF